MHTCNICLAQVAQLRRHLTMIHKISLDEYLDAPEKRICFERIEQEMRQKRSINSPFSINYYTVRGFSEAEGKQKISELRNKAKKPKFRPAQVEFYKEKGFTETEAVLQVKLYKERISKQPTKKSLCERYGEELGIVKWEKVVYNRKNRLKKFIDRFDSDVEGKMTLALKQGYSGSKVQGFDYNDFQSYSKACRLLTKLVLILYRSKIDPNGDKLGREYGKGIWSLDHKFSIYGGFYHQVDPFKISALDNLRIITRKENASKSQFCIISLEEVKNFKTVLDEECLSTLLREEIKNVFNRKS